ncbi:MAG: SRPBCC family protein [Leucobacter sp.]
MTAESKVVSAEREVAADAATIFELIADPAQQPRWDGNGNLVEAAPDQRVRAVGDVFVMRIHNGENRDNHVVEFEEGRRIAWKPAPPGAEPPGHLWRWEVELLPGGSLVRHTYDWSGLTDEGRFARARQNTSEALLASIDRLAAIAEA